MLKACLKPTEAAKFAGRESVLPGSGGSRQPTALHSAGDWGCLGSSSLCSAAVAGPCPGQGSGNCITAAFRRLLLSFSCVHRLFFFFLSPHPHAFLPWFYAFWGAASGCLEPAAKGPRIPAAASCSGGGFLQRFELQRGGKRQAPQGGLNASKRYKMTWGCPHRSVTIETSSDTFCWDLVDH